MTRTIRVHSFLLLLSFLLAHPILGQTSITVDTTLTADHMGGISIDADNITLDCDSFSPHFSHLLFQVRFYRDSDDLGIFVGDTSSDSRGPRSDGRFDRLAHSPRRF